MTCTFEDYDDDDDDDDDDDIDVLVGDRNDDEGGENDNLLGLYS